MKADPRLLRIGNRTTLRKLLVVSVLMFGFGWALVPLYQEDLRSHRHQCPDRRATQTPKMRRAIRRWTARAR